MLEYFPPDNEKNDRVFFLPKKHQTPGTSNYMVISWPQKPKNHLQVTVLPEKVLNSWLSHWTDDMLWLEQFIYSQKGSRRFFHILFWNSLWDLFVKASIALKLTTMSRKKPQVCVDMKESSGFAFQISFFTSHIIMDNQKLI